MKLSVILPCFNGASTIGVQLEALTCQSWPHGWEVIVADNGSTDHSMEIVRTYEGRLPGLRIVPAHRPGTARLGVPHSYNTGIAAATGDAFAFCEADDEVAPGWLAALGDALRVHDFVVARLEHRKLNASWLHPPRGNGYQADGLFRQPYPPHYVSASAAGFALRRSLYEAIGPLDVAFPIVHDGEYCWRAQAAGYRLHFEPRAVVHYREKEAAADRYRQGRAWGRDTTRMHLQFGSVLGRFPVPRQLMWIARCLPDGGQALLTMATDHLRGRRMWAEWVWNLGWSVGKLDALLATGAWVAAPKPGDTAAALVSARRQH